MTPKDITGMTNRACIFGGITANVPFAACNDYHCKNSVLCKRTNVLAQGGYNLVFVDSDRCQAEGFVDFVHITGEDLGK